jgi:predicted RNase H-like nuclease (RuvC/YqgF family)
MTEIENLQRQLAEANAEIQILQMRLKNAEMLYGFEVKKAKPPPEGKVTPTSSL